MPRLVQEPHGHTDRRSRPEEQNPLWRHESYEQHKLEDGFHRTKTTTHEKHKAIL